MRSGAAAGHTGYYHETAMYSSDDEYIDLVRPFLRDGLDAGEPTIVACTDVNAELLRRSMDCSNVELMPNGTGYSTPVRTILAFRASFAELVRNGAQQIRVVGDVPHPGTGRSWDEWMRYETAINVAYDEYPLWGLCPYDTRTAPAQVIEDARCTHPFVATPTGQHLENPKFVTPTEFLDGCDDSEAEPGRPADLSLAETSPSEARARLRQLAAHELAEPELAALELVSSELVANATRHGRPPATVQAWLDSGRITVAVSDRGPGLPDPFIGWRRPPSEATSGRGLWIAHHLCADVRVSRTPTSVVTFRIDSPELPLVNAAP